MFPGVCAALVYDPFLFHLRIQSRFLLRDLLVGFHHCQFRTTVCLCLVLLVYAALVSCGWTIVANNLHSLIPCPSGLVAGYRTNETQSRLSFLPHVRAVSLGHSLNPVTIIQTLHRFYRDTLAAQTPSCLSRTSSPRRSRPAPPSSTLTTYRHT
jgi:hypothetical protein